MHKPGVRKHSRRRFDNARMKQRAKAVRPWDEKGTCADHLAECSCHMCGNPRKHRNEKTIPERKFEARAEQEISEFA